MCLIVRQQAVPVVPRVRSRAADCRGVGLGPPDQPLEQRIAQEPPARGGIRGEDCVLHAQSPEEMTGLQSARPASNDDHRIATRGKRLRLTLGGTASLRRLLHRHNQSTQPTQSARPTRSPAREAGGGRRAVGPKVGQGGTQLLAPFPPAPPPPPCSALYRS